jgi:hypothetical protein
VGEETMTQAPWPDPFSEWAKAEDVATAFNDLIMRIRTFGLPFIATAIGAGSAFGTKEPDITARWWIACAFSSVAAVVLSGTVLGLWKKPGTDSKLKPHAVELLMLFLIALSLAAWATMIGLNKPASFSFAAPVITLGGLVLFSIYLLDRFYYSSLLVGTVNRLEALEAVALGGKVDLSHSITRAAPVWTYTILPAALYLFPVLVLVNIGLATIVYSGGGNAISSYPGLV